MGEGGVIKAFDPSVPGIADQRLARSKQQHQQNSEYPHHGKGRLIQYDAEHAVPQPGRLGRDPGMERQLARLMYVVPEIAEPGEAQGVVGDEARPVIDHENKSASEEQ
jgi:hypothetical protein